jgi:hypothetical protein
MTKEFSKKWLMWLPHVLKAWPDCDSRIWSRAYGGFNALLRLGPRATAVFKIDSVKFALGESIPFTQFAHYYFERLVHRLMTIGERPQFLFQLLIITAACLVIVSIIDSGQLLASYADYELYSAPVEHNENDVQRTAHLDVKLGSDGNNGHETFHDATSPA